MTVRTYWWIEEGRRALIARAEDSLRRVRQRPNNQVWRAKDCARSVVGTLSDIEHDHMMQPHLRVRIGVSSIRILKTRVHAQNHTVLAWLVDRRIGSVLNHAFTTRTAVEN
jgi:hypothetical protein